MKEENIFVVNRIWVLITKAQYRKILNMHANLLYPRFQSVDSRCALRSERSVSAQEYCLHFYWSILSLCEKSYRQYVKMTAIKMLLCININIIFRKYIYGHVEHNNLVIVRIWRRRRMIECEMLLFLEPNYVLVGRYTFNCFRTKLSAINVIDILY